MTALPKLKDAMLALDGRVAVLTLDRHDVRNTLTGTALIDDIEAACHWINECPDVSALVITGNGSAFSAGGNLKTMKQEVLEVGDDVGRLADIMRKGIQRIPLALQDLEVPAIAAVNGPAIGAGCDLACMCDVRIASTAAVFGETFVNVGLVSGDGGAWFLPRIVGYQRAAELTFSGRLVKPDEALALGLVLEVTEADALMSQSLELAHVFASKPPITVRATKRLLKLAERAQFKDFLDQCAFFQALCFLSRDHAEAVDAFIGKRTAQFSGRSVGAPHKLVTKSGSRSLSGCCSLGNPDEATNNAREMGSMQPIAADLFIADETSPTLIAGRRKSDGRIVFPLAGGAERDFYEPVRLSPQGVLWSFTVQRFRPKSPPYAGADDEKSFRPYAVGYVEFAGQAIVEGRLEVDDFSKLRIGMPMRLAIVPFPRADGAVLTYAFRPAEGH